MDKNEELDEILSQQDDSPVVSDKEDSGPEPSNEVIIDENAPPSPNIAHPH